MLITRRWFCSVMRLQIDPTKFLNNKINSCKTKAITVAKGFGCSWAYKIWLHCVIFWQVVFQRCWPQVVEKSIALCNVQFMPRQLAIFLTEVSWEPESRRRGHTKWVNCETSYWENCTVLQHVYILCRFNYLKHQMPNNFHMHPRLIKYITIIFI